MIIDVNVNYGFWPFRKFHIDNLAKLKKKLKENKIDLAFISHLGGVLNYQEVNEYNEELFRKIKKNNFFYFVPVINLNLKNAEENIEKFKFIKIVPNYHLYSINDRKFLSIFKKISDLKIVVFLQMRYEDERNQNPLFKVKGMDIKEIKKFALNFPEIKIILLCSYFREAVELCKIGNIFSDISFIENYKTIKSLLNYITADKILFGSHTPFLYTESQIAKINFAEVKKEDIEKIKYKNIFSLINELENLIKKRR
jgi:predicted TIM-barrel fold metal-dependent hydrolase